MMDTGIIVRIFKMHFKGVSFLLSFLGLFLFYKGELAMGTTLKKEQLNNLLFSYKRKDSKQR